jgi:four helix bundle protein
MAKTGKIKSFEDLIAWQKSKELSLMVYRVSSSGEFARDYSLKDQIRRASVSAMSNIAEGFERYSPKEFRHFLAIARGSAAEVRSQIYLAMELDYLTNEEARSMIDLCNEIGRIIAGLRRSLERKAGNK